jgi:murein DD-endopeptidase MepM/ murein hydrolase activator NlpD
MKLANPAPERPITSPYGPRRHPITGQLGRMHHGVDFGGKFPVRAAADGIIHKVGYNAAGAGHYVLIKHATNLYTAYYHGAHKTSYKVGDRIRQGDVVYMSGTTGSSTGNHLHFEVRLSPREHHTADPMAYINREQPVDKRPGPLKVDGKLGKSTWKAWQEALKRDWGYEGIVDGVPGKLTHTAIQRSVNAKTDGVLGSETRTRVQKRLKDNDFYLGPLDGVWGKGTITALQRALNVNNY